MRTADELRDEIDELKDRIKELEEDEDGDAYEDLLNECYGDVEVCGYKYASGSLLKEIDPIAFNCGLSDYNSEEIANLESELEDLEQELKDLEEEEKEICHDCGFICCQCDKELKGVKE